MMSVFNPRPTVVTVHDMMYYLPGLNAYRRGEMIYHQIMMTNSLKAATRIISVSKSTRRDICALVDHELGDKTFVVHEAAIERANADVNIREKYNLGTEKYIFFSGSLTPRKNLKRVIQAIGQVSKQIPHNFVITGGKKWLNTHVEETLRDTGIENRFIKLGYVPTEDLNLLYREADFYIHASTYEGFGLPVLEAFAQDCPVISSDNSSMPEVAGDAVIYIDPYSTQDIAEAILVAATDNTKRKEIVEKGREQFAKFSWEKAAKQTLEVLLAAASSN